MTKTVYKISEFERLQMKRIKLQAQSEIHLQALDDHWDYLQSNLGSLVMNSATSSLKSKLPPVVQNFIPFFDGGGAHDGNAKGALVRKSTSSVAEVIFDQVLDAIPFIFKGMKPVIVVFALKKLKNLIFKKKKE